MPPMLALVGPGAGAPPALSEHETMPPMSPEILPPMSPEVFLITIIIPQTLSMYSQHGTLRIDFGESWVSISRRALAKGRWLKGVGTKGVG